MAYYNRMADLTLRDMERLHQAGQRLIALGNALSSTGMQGKPALLQLLGEVHAEVEAIFRKGVVGLLNHVQRGKAPRGYDEPEFKAHVVTVMEVEVAKRQPAQAVGEAPNADGAVLVGASMSVVAEMPAADEAAGLGAAPVQEPSAR
jgi:hypothetical protein